MKTKVAIDSGAVKPLKIVSRPTCRWGFSRDQSHRRLPYLLPVPL